MMEMNARNLFVTRGSSNAYRTSCNKFRRVPPALRHHITQWGNGRADRTVFLRLATYPSAAMGHAVWLPHLIVVPMQPRAQDTRRSQQVRPT